MSLEKWAERLAVNLNVQVRMPLVVCGYPRSGTTWLTRLIADALDSPAGASHMVEDEREVASEGWDRPGKFVVRKGHYKLLEDGDVLIPGPHRLSYSHWVKYGHRGVFIVRDPRDIAISASAYHGRGIDLVLQGMVKGEWYHLPPWHRYVTGRIADIMVVTRYEDLLRDTSGELTRILGEWQVDYDRGRMEEAVIRQSFRAKRAAIKRHGDRMVGGKDLNLRMLRKGIYGSWKIILTDNQRRYCLENWRPVLEKYNYECD